LAHGCTLCTGVHFNLVLSALVVCLWYCVSRNTKHKLNKMCSGKKWRIITSAIEFGFCFSIPFH
jgi:hypothetical protein